MTNEDRGDVCRSDMALILERIDMLIGRITDRNPGAMIDIDVDHDKVRVTVGVRMCS